MTLSILTQRLATCLNQKHIMGSLALARPPAVEDVYAAYDRLRQDFIWQACVEHFERRQDDPAPMLYRSLLDIGCGVSSIGQFMALAGAEVTALDPDLTSLQQAEDDAKNQGAPVMFLHSKAEDMLKSAAQYDALLCMDVIEYIEDLDKFLWVIKQLLKPGGVIIFSTITQSLPAWAYHIFLSQYIYKRTPKGSRSFNQFRSPETLQEHLTKQGFTLNHVQPLHMVPSKGLWRMDKKGTRYLATAIQK